MNISQILPNTCVLHLGYFIFHTGPMIVNKNGVSMSVPQCVSGIKTLKLRIGKRFARIPQYESHLSRVVIKLN